MTAEPRRREQVESSVHPQAARGRFGFRGIRLTAFIAVLALILAACGGGDDPGTSVAPDESQSTGGGSQEPDASGGESGAFQPPSENVELTLWNPFTGPDGDFFVQIVDDFNSATPTCQVSVETKVGAEYAAQLEAAAAANELPHVIAAGYDALPGHVENGIVVPIDDFAEQGGYGPDMFPEAIWAAGEWKGQRVGIPIDTHTMNLYYNKALFEEAGLDPESPPTDRASFEQAITAISENTDATGYQVVGSGPGGNFLAGIQFAALFYQGGGEWTNEDFTEVTFNSQAGVDAAEYLASLVDLGAPVVESDAEINAFQQGQNGMVMSGIWETTRYSDALGDDLGIAPIPSIFGEGTWGGSHNLAVTAAGAEDENTKACAYYFIDWFSQNSLTWGAAGQIPARNEVRESDEFQNASGDGLLPLIAQVAPLAESVQFLPSFPGGGDILFGPQGAGEATTLVIGGSDAQQILDEFAAAQTEILLQNKERYGF